MTGETRLLPATKFGWWLIWAGFLSLGILPFVVPAFYVGLITTAMILSMLALSLQLLVGGTGLVSLGHGAFYGLAAYVVYLISPEGAPLGIWLTLPAAMLVSGVAALLVGAVSLRTRGFFFLMVTLAFGQLIYFVFHDTKLGGGTDGAYLARPLLSLLGWELSPRDLPRAYRAWVPYYVALVQLIAMFVATSAPRASGQPVGLLVLRAAPEVAVGGLSLVGQVWGLVSQYSYGNYGLGTYYVGSAANLKDRVDRHNQGRGPSYTAKRRLVKLVYHERFNSLDGAVKRERQIKKWTRAKKEALISGELERLTKLSKSL